MASKNDISSVVGLINNGKTFPAISLVKSNPELAAAVSKLIASRQQPLFDPNGNRANNNINKGTFFEQSREIVEKSNDSESIMQLFPDMELGAQIFISSVISPKDMTSTEIIYTAPNTILTSEVTAALIDKVREYFEKDYDIKPLLPILLREVLFETGSYVTAVIPESSIDELINGGGKIGLESISEYVDPKGDVVNIGILGDPRTPKSGSNNFIAIENFSEYKGNAPYNGTLTHKNVSGTGFEDFKDSYLKVVDNPFILKMPQVFSKIKKQKVNSILNGRKTGFSMSFEDGNKKLSDTQLQNLLYKNKDRKTNALIRVKTKEQAVRNTIGKPLILKLPSESVIPVHVPGNEKDHIGYFVLIDSEGNPLNRASNQTHFSDLQSKLNNQSSSMGSYLMGRAKNNLGAQSSITVDQASKIYSDIIEQDLLERLRTGAYGANVAISKNEEIYRVMLARALANQYTQILYLPVELVTYFAYKYDKNGVGKSLHDDLRILHSLRAMMMFSRVMASLKNSIGRTEVKLKFDEDDIDPQKTAETAIHEISRTRQQYFPLGMNSPVDLVDWIQKSGFEFTFEGHPKFPDMGIEFNEKNSNNVKPDTDLDDELRKRAIMGIGLSPETVDNGFNSEFATTVVANNILLSKRVIQVQECISPLLTDHVKKITLNDQNLIDDLKAILKENYEKIKNIPIEENNQSVPVGEVNETEVIKYLLNDFIISLDLKLPQPSSVTLENQMASFTIYSDALDKCIESWISADIINPSMSGEISSNIDYIKAIVKAHFLRKWMAENNMMTELADITTKDENGKPKINLFDIQKDHINGIVLSAVHLFKDTKTFANSADEDLNKITGGDGITEPSSFGSDSSISDEPPMVDSEPPISDANDFPDDLPALDNVG